MEEFMRTYILALATAALFVVPTSAFAQVDPEVLPGGVHGGPGSAGSECWRERCRMRIAIMAAGAVGGYFGGRMAAAGHDVTFIARGAHRDAIRRDGLKIESALGDLHLKDVNVTDDPTQVAPV